MWYKLLENDNNYDLGKKRQVKNVAMGNGWKKCGHWSQLIKIMKPKDQNIMIKKK